MNNYFKMDMNNSEKNIVEVKISTLIWIGVFIVFLVIAIIFGKKLYDKRQDIAKKDQRREAEKQFKVKNLY